MSEQPNRPTPAEIKQRIAELLLTELVEGKSQWYYISVAGDTFVGGYVLRAYGPTDAWRLLHALGWWQEDCSTQTTGPISEEVLANIPEEQRWRKLTRDEAMNLGKPPAPI